MRRVAPHANRANKGIQGEREGRYRMRPTPRPLTLAKRECPLSLPISLSCLPVPLRNVGHFRLRSTLVTGSESSCQKSANRVTLYYMCR